MADPANDRLSLADAARLLGVHPTTLRRWAVQGEIPASVTAGGHRRFLRADLERFHTARRPGEAAESAWRDGAVQHTRAAVTHARHAPWLAQLDTDARQRNRAMGQRLMGLLMQYIAYPQAPTRLEPEVHRLGLAYGDQALADGLTLGQAVQATVFFREALFDSALHEAGQPFHTPEYSLRLLRRLNRFVTLVQVAITDAFEPP